MVQREKGKSPFYPGQPVPVELFVGRQPQIDTIITRGVKQVAAGKPVAMYVQGEYGIGKSSIASYIQRLAERQHGLLRIYANLGGASDLDGMAVAVVEGALKSGAFEPSRGEAIKNWLAKYIGEQKIFGFSVNLEALKKDAHGFTTPSQMLGFLAEAKKRVEGTGIKGIFLVLDELNGIVNDPQFAHFIKGLIEENAMSEKPLPLLLMLCGVEERRRQMIHHHTPVDRIFEIVEIENMSEEEMTEFFNKSFASVGMTVQPAAMKNLTLFSAGFPKIMHLIGDAAYFIDSDGNIDVPDASKAVFEAANEVGKKYVDQQIYRAIRSADYRSIMAKIAKMGPNKMTFMKREVMDGLGDNEKKKLSNFLSKMKKLNVIRSGDVAGEYIFNMRMVRFYIWLQSIQEKKKM